MMLPSETGFISEPRWLRLHQEVREGFGTSLIAWAKADDAAAIWFELARDQEGRRDFGAARRSLARALTPQRKRQLSQGALSNAHLLYALLVLGDGLGEQVLAQAEHHLREALADTANPFALWHLGRVLVHQGDVPGGEERMREGLAAMASIGLRESAMVLGTHAAHTRASQIADDAAAFETWCESSPALEEAPELARKLVAAVAALKRHVDDVQWLVEWGVESSSLFGPYGPQYNAAAYGETPFRSWQQIMSRPAVASALASHSQPSALICGCALGYMALYFLSIGVACTGVDLLARSMVDTAARVCDKHGLNEACGLTLTAGDALALPPRPVHSLLWLNNEAWLAKARREMLQRALLLLAPGGVVISYGAAGGSPPRGLRLIDQFFVRVSWSARQEIRVLARL